MPLFLQRNMAKTLPRMRRDWALFLDVDGTLLEFAETPDQVEVPHGLIDILGAAHGFLGGALALVSGRPLADLDRLFAPLRLPAAGQHGAELRAMASGVVVKAPTPPGLVEMIAGLRRFAASRHGVLVEDKNASVAIHFKRAPQYRDEIEKFTRSIAAGDDSMEILEAVMAFDVKPRSVDKGRAVAWFMRHPPFAGRVPVFVGDDRTDEDGFAAAAERAGHAIQVGTARPRVAAWHVPAPADVRRWLRANIADEAPS